MTAPAVIRRKRRKPPVDAQDHLMNAGEIAALTGKHLKTVYRWWDLPLGQRLPYVTLPSGNGERPMRATWRSVLLDWIATDREAGRSEVYLEADE